MCFVVVVVVVLILVQCSLNFVWWLRTLKVKIVHGVLCVSLMSNLATNGREPECERLGLSALKSNEAQSR